MEEVNDSLIVKRENADCNKYAEMAGLNELIFHDCHIEKLSALVKMPHLKVLGFARCTFGNEHLPALEGAPALARINLHSMDAAGLEELHNIRNLKRLGLWNVTNFQLGNLALYENLFTLEFDDRNFNSGDVICRFVNLKKLYLYHSVMDNLDFLKMLPNLVKFRLLKPAANEEGLIGLNKFPNLKEFIYPVKDLSLYKGCEKLKEPGISPKTTGGFEVFKGSKVECFIICGSTSNEQVNYIAKEMKRHCKIYSYGRQS